jgi:HTH-type transcriptional regulator/antitoxin HigA
MQADCHYQIQMENGLHPTHSESRRIRREGVAKMMIAVPEKYALEVGSPTLITSERQHEQYLSVLDKLASKEKPTTEEEKYAEVLMTLIEAYEEDHHSIPDASPVEVLRTEVLHKKRDLNKTHIEKLSRRFNVSPAVFF